MNKKNTFPSMSLESNDITWSPPVSDDEYDDDNAHEHRRLILEEIYFMISHTRKLLFETHYKLFSKCIKTIAKQECPVCLEFEKNMQFIKTRCGHIFCVECMEKLFCFKYTTTSIFPCPMCRQNILSS